MKMDLRVIDQMRSSSIGLRSGREGTIESSKCCARNYQDDLQKKRAERQTSEACEVFRSMQRVSYEYCTCVIILGLRLVCEPPLGKCLCESHGEEGNCTGQATVHEVLCRSRYGLARKFQKRLG